MPIPTLTLWADANNNSFARGYQLNQTLSNLQLKQGDTLGVELHWIENGVTNLHKEVIWDNSVNITLAVGVIDTPPTAGSFKLSYASATTSNLSYTATALEMQNALNALAPITAEGGVTVVKSATTYRIVWNDEVVPSSSITVGENNLLPTSSIGIGSVRTGTALVSQITQMHIKQAPVAVCTSWVNQDAPSITVTETASPTYSGDYRVWRLVISPNPKGGTFRLNKTINGSDNWTQSISVDNLSSSYLSSLTGLSVIQVSAYEFELSQSQISGNTLVNVSNITPDGAGLIGYSAKFGYLNLNSVDVDLLLNGKESVSVVCEVEVELDGKRQTLVQSNATIYNDLIDTDSYSIVEWGSLVPADSVVRYDTPQTLTAPQKAQVLTNIGAVGSASLTPFTTKDNELEGRIANIETVGFSTNVRNALNGASSPTSSNVFVTANELATKANTSHTHTIANITGLQTALDGKSGIGSPVSISDVSGLAVALSDLTTGKANLTHTHIVADVTGLQTTLTGLSASIAGKADFYHTHEVINITDFSAGVTTAVQSEYGFVAAGTTASPSPFTTTTYPFEISITIGSTVYKIPARYA